jgi:hypothetical protein
MAQIEYVYEKTITFPGMTARIFRPVLTEEERNRRMEEIKKAAANLVKEVLRNEKINQVLESKL